MNNLPGPGDQETWGPCTGHPGDPRTEDRTESVAFEDTKQEMREKNMGGLAAEALSEMSQLTEKRLSEAVMTYEIGTDVYLRTMAKLEIGEIVWSVVHNYCVPTDEDVIEALGGDDG